MNLLVIPSWYETPDNPIRGIFFKEQAHALADYFIENNIDATVTIIALQQYNLKERHLYKGIPKLSIKKDGNINVLQSFFLHIPKLETANFYLGAKKLKKCILFAQKKLNFSFDLIHIHSALFSGIWYSLSNLKIPYVVTEHSSLFYRNLVTSTAKKYIPLVYNNAKEVFAVGKGLSERVQYYSNNPVEIFFNSVKSVPISVNDSKKSDAFTFLSLGYDIKVKGFDILLQAFSNFLSKAKCRLIIGGLSDADQKKLKVLIDELELQDFVELIGQIKHETVFEYMQLCDCFVLASRYETFGVVLAEAMYCGKLVIATRTGGPDSFVNEQNGIIVEPENIEQLTDALNKMYENYSSYKPEIIKKYAEEKFSENAVCSKLVDIYTKIINF